MTEPMAIVAIGYLASQLREPISRIRTAATALKIETVYRISGVDHYTEADGERIADYLREQREAANV